MRRIFIPLALCLALALTADCGGGGNTGTVPGPAITSIAPPSGGVAGGTVLVLQGTNLANTGPGRLTVTIGGRPAAWTRVIDATSVECETPSGTLGLVDVEIVNEFGASTATDGFMYYAGPTVDAITPPSGTFEGGTAVTITGTGFTDNDAGTTVCHIGLKELLNLSVENNTTITGITPSSWSQIAKDVTVRNNNGEGVLPLGYAYRGPPPEIFSVIPAYGSREGGTELTITGARFTGNLTVHIGTNQANFVTAIDEGTITCITPPSALAGTFEVVVANFNGGSTPPGSFEYLRNPLPTSIDPTSGAISGGEPVTIYGSDFAGGGPMIVTFGGSPATNVVIHDGGTRITCITPAGRMSGTNEVLLTNDISSGSVPGGFEYLGPAFWWEETFGPRLTSITSWSSFQLVNLTYGFPFYGTQYSNNVYCIAAGQIHFGGYTTGQFSIDIIQTDPHITVLGGLLYPVYGGATNAAVYMTDHVPNRTIFTWDHLPEYSGLGANSFQLHLHSSGIFAMVYKDTTYNLQTVGYGVNITCGVSRGTDLGTTGVPVVWTAGPLSSEADEAFYQHWLNGARGDLDNCMLTFYPNSDGGFDSVWLNELPSDPHP